MNAKSIRAHSMPAPPSSIIGVYARAILLGGAAAALLLLTGTAICYAQPDPSAALKPFALAALYLSAAVCGLTAGRASERTLITGAAAGGLYCLLVTALSLIPVSDATGYSPGISIVLHIGIIAAALAGAWLGRRRTVRKTHSHKKRRR